MSKKINQEYERLKKLFANVDESKAELVDGLLKKASFLIVELDKLQKDVQTYGAVERSNKGNVRESIYYKTFLSTLSVYQGIIKTLNTIMGKNVIDEDDEFDDFVKRAYD